MAERQGHPVWAVVIGAMTVALVGFGAFTAVIFMATGGTGWSVAHYAEWGVPLAAFLVVGLWLAWRVGSGHWGLRRRPTEPVAEPPEAGVDREGGS